MNFLVSLLRRRPARPVAVSRKPVLEDLEGRELLDAGPIDPAAFAAKLYQDFLQRTPSTAETGAWVGAYNAGAVPVGIASAFATSAEYRGREIQGDYHAFLGRDAEAGAVANWLTRLPAGDVEEQLAVTFLASAEYVKRQGGTTDGWLTGLYRDALGRAPDDAGKAAWAQAVQNGLSRDQAARAFVQSGEARRRGVDTAYRQFLHRPSDAAGATTWLALRQQGLTTTQMSAAFASSPEYCPPLAGPALGANASLGGRPLMPAASDWNRDVSTDPVDPNSANLISSIGLTTGLHPDFGTTYNGAPNGIPYVIVPGTQPKVPVTFDYADESDPGPYPIPPDAPIEDGPSGTGDRHVLVLDRDNWKLYELYDAHPQADGSWHAGSGAIFDLRSGAARPAGWTSADAAGLPILPGLVRYDEVHEQQEIDHALRFTVQRTRHAYVAPASHFASSLTDVNLPPMGMRVRLRADFDVTPFPAPVQVILRALKKYGMIVADNGSNWHVSGAPDPRWNDDELHTLTQVLGSNFEVVKMGTVVTHL